ncbi:sialidase family protein [Nonlabens sp. Asnod3-A02]|uniref:sialidase family protein n=1 Tax=Nonlabens sp. Asnod3-A02 TaxID=3160579 RepID=UPI003868FF17
MRGILIFVLLFVVVSSSAQEEVFSYVWKERVHDIGDDNVIMGPLANLATSVVYQRDEEDILQIEFGKKVKVYEAKKTQSWGFVQFPKLFKTVDDELAITWRMNPDKSGVQFKSGWKYSSDLGKKWTFRWAERPVIPGVKLNNGNYIKFLSNYKNDSLLPINALPFETRTNYSKTNYQFYDLDTIPKSLLEKDVIKYNKDSGKFEKEKIVLENDKRLIYNIGGKIPNIMWGPLLKLENGILIKAMYPGYLKTENNCVTNSSIVFYKSDDNGESWSYQGSISPLKKELDNKDVPQEFTEPSLEVLEDGSLITIFRSSLGIKTAPMYAAKSKDLGKTWSSPRKITPNGVLPQLLKLENGVLVLTSGRPGVQIRFNAEGDGIKWTEPFEMLKYKGLRGQVSCGYTGIIPTSENSFLLVYSDFRNRDEQNRLRKAILVREIVVKKL